MGFLSIFEASYGHVTPAASDFQTFSLDAGLIIGIKCALLDRFLACMKPASITYAGLVPAFFFVHRFYAHQRTLPIFLARQHLTVGHKVERERNDLEGKTAMITGSNSGIGLGIARDGASQGRCDSQFVYDTAARSRASSRIAVNSRVSAILPPICRMGSLPGIDCRCGRCRYFGE